VDAETGEEVESADIIKGYPVDKNVYVTVDEEELEAIQIESTHTIEIDSFVPASEIDARFYESPYYIVPNDKVGQDAFAVIRDAMKSKGMVGVGRVVIGKRERPIILEPLGKGLRGMTLRYPYEVRKEDEYFADIPDVKVPGEMLKLAEHIVETKAGEFDPSAFEDHYETALVDLLKKKQAGIKITKQTPKLAAAQTSNVIDLLKRSLEMEGQKGKKKSPPLVPDIPKSRRRQRA
jgi:DNA end-binding protein Ku